MKHMHVPNLTQMFCIRVRTITKTERQKEINNSLMISPAMFQPQMDLTDIHLEKKKKATRANVTLMSSFLVRWRFSYLCAKSTLRN